MFADLATRTYVTVVERMRATVDKGEEGQGMIEYGLLVALISIVAIGVITAIGTGLIGNFQSVKNAL
jgi:pilus assembly protein Flp/PilA